MSADASTTNNPGVVDWGSKPTKSPRRAEPTQDQTAVDRDRLYKDVKELLFRGCTNTSTWDHIGNTDAVTKPAERRVVVDDSNPQIVEDHVDFLDLPYGLGLLFDVATDDSLDRAQAMHKAQQKKQQEASVGSRGSSVGSSATRTAQQEKRRSPDSAAAQPDAAKAEKEEDATDKKDENDDTKEKVEDIAEAKPDTEEKTAAAQEEETAPKNAISEAAPDLDYDNMFPDRNGRPPDTLIYLLTIAALPPPPPDRCLSLYDQGMDKLRRDNAVQEAKIKAKQEEEQKQCTFKPEVSDSAKRHQGRGGIEQFFKSTVEWQKASARKLERKKLKAEAEFREDNMTQWKMNKRSEKLADKARARQRAIGATPGKASPTPTTSTTPVARVTFAPVTNSACASAFFSSPPPPPSRSGSTAAQTEAGTRPSTAAPSRSVSQAATESQQSAASGSRQSDRSRASTHKSSSSAKKEDQQQQSGREESAAQTDGNETVTRGEAVSTQFPSKATSKQHSRVPSSKSQASHHSNTHHHPGEEEEEAAARSKESSAASAHSGGSQPRDGASAAAEGSAARDDDASSKSSQHTVRTHHTAKSSAAGEAVARQLVVDNGGDGEGEATYEPEPHDPSAQHLEEDQERGEEEEEEEEMMEEEEEFFIRDLAPHFEHLVRIQSRVVHRRDKDVVDRLEKDKTERWDRKEERKKEYLRKQKEKLFDKVTGQPLFCPNAVPTLEREGGRVAWEDATDAERANFIKKLKERRCAIPVSVRRTDKGKGGDDDDESASHQRTTDMDQVVQRLLDKDKTAKNKIQKLHRRDEQELKTYFHPKIEAKSAEMTSSHGDRIPLYKQPLRGPKKVEEPTATVHKSNDKRMESLLQRQEAFINHKQNLLRRKKAQDEKELVEQCSFKPQLTRETERIASESRSRTIAEVVNYEQYEENQRSRSAHEIYYASEHPPASAERQRTRSIQQQQDNHQYSAPTFGMQKRPRNTSSSVVSPNAGLTPNSTSRQRERGTSSKQQQQQRQQQQAAYDEAVEDIPREFRTFGGYVAKLDIPDYEANPPHREDLDDLVDRMMSQKAKDRLPFATNLPNAQQHGAIPPSPRSFATIQDYEDAYNAGAAIPGADEPSPPEVQYLEGLLESWNDLEQLTMDVMPRAADSLSINSPNQAGMARSYSSGVGGPTEYGPENNYGLF